MQQPERGNKPTQTYIRNLQSVTRGLWKKRRFTLALHHQHLNALLPYPPGYKVLTPAAASLCVNDSPHGLWRNAASELTPVRTREAVSSRHSPAFHFPSYNSCLQRADQRYSFSNQRADWRSVLDSSSAAGFAQMWAVGCLGPTHLYKADINLRSKPKHKG